jgi:hypothetical protein
MPSFRSVQTIGNRRVLAGRFPVNQFSAIHQLILVDLRAALARNFDESGHSLSAFS